MSPAPLDVYVVDDDDLARRSLARLLRSTGYAVESFASGEEFLACELTSAPACLILDLQMPEADGLQVQEKLCARGDILPVIFLTAHGEIHQSVKALKAGAVDFLTKPCDENILLTAISHALLCARKWRRQSDRSAEALERIHCLTPREHEVLGWIITGKLNKQIAGLLGTSDRTIKAHRSQVMKKLGVVSVAELVWLAEQAGLRPTE